MPRRIRPVDLSSRLGLLGASDFRDHAGQKKTVAVLTAVIGRSACNGFAKVFRRYDTVAGGIVGPGIWG